MSRSAQRIFLIGGRPSSECPMNKFSKRNMLIFILCLLFGTVLIGLGMAYVIELKQRIFPIGPNNVTTGENRINRYFWHSGAVTYESRSQLTRLGVTGPGSTWRRLGV